MSVGFIHCSLSFVVCYICCCSFGSSGFIIAALLNYYMLSAFLDSTDSEHLMLLDFIYVKFLLVLTTRINTLCRRRLRQQWMPCLQDLAKDVSWKTVLSKEEERWEKEQANLVQHGAALGHHISNR